MITPRVRRGLREILADALPEAIFSEADSGDEVLSLLATSEFALLTLDINMPGSNGLDVLRDVKRILPAIAGNRCERPAGRPVCYALFAGWRSRLCQQKPRS